jgi:hypothetical protein
MMYSMQATMKLCKRVGLTASESCSSATSFFAWWDVALARHNYFTHQVSAGFGRAFKIIMVVGEGSGENG